MAYRVQAGSLTIVVPWPREALRVRDSLLDDHPETFISDMNGSPLDVDWLREVAEETESE